MNVGLPLLEKLNFTKRFQYRLMQNVFGIFREMRWTYIPPLMVYLAAGVSGFTGIIESFYIKEELGLSAAFTNLALSASQLGTKYLNKIFIIERGQYGELGMLMISVAMIGLIIPVATVLLFNPDHGIRSMRTSGNGG